MHAHVSDITSTHNRMSTLVRVSHQDAKTSTKIRLFISVAPLHASGTLGNESCSTIVKEGEGGRREGYMKITLMKW